jgi:hypothetical protein
LNRERAASGRPFLFFLVVLVVGLAGCGSSDGPKIAKAHLASLVLQPADVPGFTQFSDNAQARSDVNAGPRGHLDRFGRVGGWIARYRRGGDAKTPGPLVVESRADLFGSAGGAKEDLDAYAGEFAALYGGAGGRRLDAPKIGAGAVAYGLVQRAVRFYAIAWREGNATASVVAQGFSLSLVDAAALARKQERRIASAG